MANSSPLFCTNIISIEIELAFEYLNILRKELCVKAVLEQFWVN